MTNPVRAYLKLIRLPNVITALADIGAGFLIAHTSASGAVPWARLPALLGASAGLYLAGMAFNDLADREEDARFRPERPIPSGAVSLHGAILCGAGLMLFAFVCAALSGRDSLLHAALIAVAVLLYNFGAKHIAVAGPVVLGVCRYLNVQLGMSGADGFAAHWSDPVFWRDLHAPALAVGVYAAGLTAFGAQEETGKRNFALVLGWIFVGGALLLAGLTAPHVWVWLTLGPLALLLAWRSVTLARTGTPLAARHLVVNGVMGICALDAGLVLGQRGSEAWPWALGLLALLIPGRIIFKWLAQREA
ncbi:MAG: UbiA family prenyltransferase [Planctomycetes bacterium]|nr:UbiA family prenyltransferase [Planctomycetota bacterium]